MLACLDLSPFEPTTVAVLFIQREVPGDTTLTRNRQISELGWPELSRNHGGWKPLIVRNSDVFLTSETDQGWGYPKRVWVTEDFEYFLGSQK